MSSFRLYPLRFNFVARESIHFPAGKSSNVLRGAFGTIFRRLACDPKCPGARRCEQRAACPYARVFEPGPLADAASGYGDWPRPFVFRSAHLDDRTVASGDEFYFDLNLFDTQNPAIQFFALAFAEVSREGIGPRRGRADLLSIAGEDAMSLLLDPPERPVDRVRVQFVTPTELKGGG